MRRPDVNLGWQRKVKSYVGCVRGCSGNLHVARDFLISLTSLSWTAVIVGVKRYVKSALVAVVLSPRVVENTHVELLT